MYLSSVDDAITRNSRLYKKYIFSKKKNSMASVRKQTTERPPLVNEVSANLLWIEGAV
jgi:hypothetical protein